MSVPVGFFKAPTSLIAPAPGTRPDGAPADGGAEGGGTPGLFAALLAMLAPGAQLPADAETATPAQFAAAVAAAPVAVVPPAEQPPIPVAPELPQLTDLQQSEAGKALLKDFTDALKAARSALDEGKPLDQALEKKLTEIVEAIGAFIAGAPQLQPAPVDTSRLSELASGSNLLPAPPAGDLPPAPADTGDASPDLAAANVAEPPKAVQAQIVPLQLAELGTALKDFAAELEKAAPELSRALAQLADRLAVGDIADDAMAQFGLTRTPGSTSPVLDQLVAALTARPTAKTTTATAAPIAVPVLDVPDILAGQPAAVIGSSEAKTGARTAEVRTSDATKPEMKSEARQPDPLVPTADLELDAEVKLDIRATRPADEPAVADSKPTVPAASAGTNTAAPVAAPVTTNADAAAQGVQAAQAAAVTAATATRAIHAAYSAPVQQLNYPQVAFEVARHFEAGNSRFQIRLDPADLGRIDVRLDLDKSGTVSAHMFVERPETLDLMQRDQRALQQALQQAGLDAGKTSLEFSLRQNPFTGADTGQGGGNGQPGFGPFGTPAADESTELAAQTLYRGSASASGVNLFV